MILSYPHQIVYLAYYSQTNHIYYKNIRLSDFQFYLYLYADKQGMYHRHREKRSRLTAYDMSLTYVKTKSGPRIEPRGTPQDADAD